MAKWLTSISSNIQEFIEKQQLFFVSTAAKTGNVNVSPKGLDTLKVMDKNRVVWVNLGGSGNETENHILESNRMTLMFCSFVGNPLILRLYGSAKVIRPEDDNWKEMLDLFPEMPRARQVFDMKIEQVQTYCGYGVPLFQYVEQRGKLMVAKK